MTSGGGSTFAASSWTQLTLTLCSVEKEIGVIRLKADERVLKEAERVKMVARKRQELIEEHKKHVQDRIAEYASQLENIEAVAERDIREHTLAKERADARIETAELCARRAEANAKELEKEVKRLYALHDKACADHDRRLVAVRSRTDDKVQRKLGESNRLVRDTGLYASEVQAGAEYNMAEMESSMRLKIRDLEAECNKRSRYQELYDVALSHSAREIPSKEYHAAKGSIFQGWHESWVDHVTKEIKPAESPGQRALLPSSAPGSLNNTQTLSTAEDVLDTVAQRAAFSPSSPDTPRSKERALGRAAEHRRFRQERDARLRPKTAP